MAKHAGIYRCCARSCDCLSQQQLLLLLHKHSRGRQGSRRPCLC